MYLQIVKIKTGEILGHNAVGNLFIRSPCMMKGYLVHKDKEVQLD
jgi:acyl-CoA synthetase (AMP-forming)/AMP-acid ligase II